MALDTISIARLEITKIYIAAFNRAPDAAGLSNWMNQYTAGLMTYKQISEDFSNQAEYKAKYPSAMTNDEYITKIYSNVFGRTPDAGGLENWVSQLDNSSVTGYTRGNIMKAMLEAAGATGNTDGIRLANQAEFAVQAVIVDGVSDDIATAQLANITSDHATVDTATAAVAGYVGGAAGETFALTKGLDNITGTTANDTINGSIDSGNVELNTMAAIDTIDGGTGIDTFKLSASTALATADLATLTNVEIMTVNAASTVTLDTTSITGLTNLNTTKSTTVDLTAAATTDVSVSGASSTIVVKGGKDVTVNDATTNVALTVGNAAATTGSPAGKITVTDTNNAGGTNDITITGGTDVTVVASAKAATGDIIVGHATNGKASGNVSVTQNILDDGAAGIDNSLLPITVTGGKTVAVNINGTSTADASIDSGVLKLSATTVVGDGVTTDVTVTQTKTVNIFTAPTVPLVAEKTTITFAAMTAGQTVTLTAGNSLTFTAAKALTATEVAAAFANLIASDRQTSSGPVANGTFTGQFSAEYTSATNAAGVLVLTGIDDAVTDITFGGTATAPTQVKTAGTAAGATSANFSTNTIDYGTVRVDGNATASITTVTLNGFASADLGATGTDLNALTTLNLSNNTANGNVTVGTTSTALTLNVDNITSTTSVIDFSTSAGAALADLTIATSGTASTFDLTNTDLVNLTVNAAVGLNIATNAAANYATSVLKTVDVNGAGAVNLGDLSSAVALNTFDASGNTGGVTATVETADTDLTGTITEYKFSEGNDVVTLLAATGTVMQSKITLGAGDDLVDLSTGDIATLSEVIDGGTGSNTIKLKAAIAESVTADATFEGKISNFSKLSLAAVATTADNTVNLANMDDISYVISAGTADTAEVTVLTTVSTAATAVANDVTLSLVVGGTTFTYTAAGGTADENSMLVGLAALIQADARVTTATVSGDVDNATLTITGATGAALIVGTLTDSAAAITATNEVTSSELFLTNMANNGTLELTSTGLGATVTMTDATSLTDDVFNILTGNGAGNVGTVVVNSVETLNVTTTDVFTDTTGALDGNGGAIADGVDDTNSTATLVVVADAAKVINVYGAGDLTLTTADAVLTTVNASTMTGVLTYTASVNSVVVTGGSAGDSLTATGDDVTLNGGDGADTLTVNAAADRAILNGGAGNDTFVISGASSTSSTYANITTINSGDTIQFTGADSFAATKVTLSAGATETTQALMDLAIQNLGANDMGWFQTGGNTFIVMDVANSGTTFTGGTDKVVMITGLVDLSTASYNATSNTLEIA